MNLIVRFLFWIGLNVLTARFWLYPGHPKVTTYLWCLILILSGAIIIFTPLSNSKKPKP